jgi:hypothetical protein
LAASSASSSVLVPLLLEVLVLLRILSLMVLAGPAAHVQLMSLRDLCKLGNFFCLHRSTHSLSHHLQQARCMQQYRSTQPTNPLLLACSCTRRLY